MFHKKEKKKVLQTRALRIWEEDSQWRALTDDKVHHSPHVWAMSVYILTGSEPSG